MCGSGENIPPSKQIKPRTTRFLCFKNFGLNNSFFFFSNYFYAVCQVNLFVTDRIFMINLKGRLENYFNHVSFLDMNRKIQLLDYF